MQVSLCPAKFKSLPTSALALEKPGGMSFEFANGSGERQYDWSTKVVAHPTQTTEPGLSIKLRLWAHASRRLTFWLGTLQGQIMLNPTEAAELLCGRGEISFYHDPNKGRQGEGTVGKKMTVVGTNDNSGYFFNLSACRCPLARGSPGVERP